MLSAHRAGTRISDLLGTHSAAAFDRFAPALPPFALVFLVTGLLAGCGGAEIPDRPPAGWQSEGPRWWRTGVDTATAFSDRTDLNALGVDRPEVVFDPTVPVTDQAERLENRLVNEVRRSLLPIFRHRPEVIDSLFSAVVEPEIRSGEIPTRETLSERVERERAEALGRLREQFEEPRLRQPAEGDRLVEIPDSLREAGLRGRVRVGVYLDSDGRPGAVRLLSGVHPAVDDAVLAAASRSRWRPASVDGEPIASWAPLVVRVGVADSSSGPDAADRGGSP